MAMTLTAFRGNRLDARAARSTVWLALGYGGSQALRLASNLILARLLFPEAFGLMALVTVFLVGLTMFSDLGLGPAIAQHKRGDDPDFLNTGWTLQVVRGAVLWLICCAVAWPAAAFYEAPMLAQLLPVAGLSLVIAGFRPTRFFSANRHLTLGRLSALDLSAQSLGIGVMIGVALVTGSVWALVVGGIVGSVAQVVLLSLYLPGAGNRLRWDRTAVAELSRFGKWIFLSTICGFFLMQGDKAILGKVLPLDLLGIYNIAFFLASFPVLLGLSVVTKVMIPLYREAAPAEEAVSVARLRRMRLVLTGGLMALLGALAIGGDPLVRLLYEAEYHAAGPIVVLIACVQMLTVVGMTYDQVALAKGNSRAFFALTAARMALVLCGLLIGALGWGLIGALAGQACAAVLAWPLIARLAARYGAWDPLHDAAYGAMALCLAAAAIWLNRVGILALVELAR